MKDVDDSLEVPVGELQQVLVGDAELFSLADDRKVRLAQLMHAEVLSGSSNVLGVAGEMAPPLEVGRRVDAMITSIESQPSIGLYDGWGNDMRRLAICCIEQAHMKKHSKGEDADNDVYYNYARHLSWSGL